MVNVSGHRLGTTEVESALLAAGGGAIASEAAVVGVPHPIKGQSLAAFVVLAPGVEPTEAARAQLRAAVRASLGGLAVPDAIMW